MTRADRIFDLRDVAQRSGSKPVTPNAVNFTAGESSADSLDEAFPNRIEALLGLAILRWRRATGSHGQAQPSA